MLLTSLFDVGSLQLESPRKTGGLAIVPLTGPHREGPDLLSLGEALRSGEAEVTETSEGGSVPELRLVNRSDRIILLLDGEELVGAKQNRVLNLTVLAPPRAETIIPVSCVEAGRWSWRSRGFSSAERTLYAKARRDKAEAVSDSLKRSGTARSDQGRIWSDIDLKSRRMRVSSATAAAGAMYERSSLSLNKMVEDLRPVAFQVGAVFFVNGQLAGVECFGSSSMYARQAAKLVRGYGLDALDSGLANRSDQIEMRPEQLSELVAGADCEPHRKIGVGEGYRINSNRFVGALLKHQGELVHLSAFSKTVG
jgi:hypothetical protein